jgi:hypothetical protein
MFTTWTSIEDYEFECHFVTDIKFMTDWELIHISLLFSFLSNGLNFVPYFYVDPDSNLKLLNNLTRYR